MALERDRTGSLPEGGLNWRPNLHAFVVAVGVLAAAEGGSLVVFGTSALRLAAALLITGAAVLLTVRRLELGVLIVLGELFIGGKGYLFGVPVGSGEVSIRMLLFAALLAVWAFRAIRSGSIRPHLPSAVRRWGLALFAVLGFGVALGLLRGTAPSGVALDANAFLYAALILVLAWPHLDWHYLAPRVSALLAAGTAVVGLKSLLVLGLFVHLGADQLLPLYRWIRDTGVGEIAPIFGGTYRVFLQGQVYGLLGAAVLGALLLASTDRSRPWPRWLLLPVTLGVTATLVSLSRSLWLGAAAAAVVLGMLGCRWFGWRLRDLAVRAGGALAVLAVAFTLNSWALNFPTPWPAPGGARPDAVLAGRIAELSGGAATDSRVELARVLHPTILRSPLWGWGFGTTVTYQSSDPRQVSGPEHGRYTTAAFELGYHDLAVKTGALGVITLLGLLLAVGRTLVQLRTPVALGWLAGLVGLAVLHATTPYLNHPLGIGYVLLAVIVGREAVQAPEERGV